MCNKCLRKTSYRFLTKIDGDQVYRTEYLRMLRNSIFEDKNSLYLLCGLNVYRNLDNKLVLFSKLQRGGDYTFNGYLDTFVFRKTIFTMFIKHKTTRKIEFLYVPFMGTNLRPFKKFQHVVWLHSKTLKYHQQLKEYISFDSLDCIDKEFFDSADRWYINYQLGFFVERINGNYKLTDETVKDLKYWYDFVLKTKYIENRINMK